MREVVLWPRVEVMERVVEGLSNLVAGRARVRNSIVNEAKVTRWNTGSGIKVSSGGKGRYVVVGNASFTGSWSVAAGIDESCGSGDALVLVSIGDLKFLKNLAYLRSR